MVEYIVRDDFTGDSLKNYQHVGYPGVSLRKEPTRHPGQGCAYFELPWHWEDEVDAPAAEERVPGVFAYGKGNLRPGQVDHGPDPSIGFSFLAPKGNVTGESITICQFHPGKVDKAAGYLGQPNLALRLGSDNQLSLRLRSAPTADVADKDSFAVDFPAGLVTPGQWCDIVLRTLFSFKDGFTQAWRNDKQFCDFTGRNIGSPSEGKANFFKIGCYAPAQRKTEMPSGVTQVVVICNLSIAMGGAFADVDPAQWPQPAPKPAPDREALHAWLTEAEDLAPQIAAWWARGKELVG